MGWSPFAKGRIFHNKELQEFSKKNKMSIAELAVRWNLSHRIITIPKASTLEKLKENFVSAQRGALPSEILEQLNAIEFDSFGVSWDPTTVE